MPYTLTWETSPGANFQVTVWHDQAPKRRKGEKLTSGFYSLSASANTMQGLFPPSSRVTLFRLLFPAASLIILPTWNGALQKRRLKPALPTAGLLSILNVYEVRAVVKFHSREISNGIFKDLLPSDIKAPTPSITMRWIRKTLMRTEIQNTKSNLDVHG